jgi:hypothetical protein
MSLSQTEIANHETLRIYVAQLQFRGNDKTLTNRQLWGSLRRFDALTCGQAADRAAGRLAQ